MPTKAELQKGLDELKGLVKKFLEMTSPDDYCDVGADLWREAAQLTEYKALNENSILVTVMVPVESFDLQGQDPTNSSDWEIDLKFNGRKVESAFIDDVDPY